MAGLAVAGLHALVAFAPAFAAPYIWDQDDNRIDDRVETVHLGGYALAFEDGDTLQRQRIDVAKLPNGLIYGIYVVYLQEPTSADLSNLATVGVPVLHRYEGTPAVKSIANFLQIQLVAGLPGVERVEAVPILYPVARDGTAAMAVRDATEQAFPTWAGTGGASGEGVVVAILDTGINDAANGFYPGHESLSGRFLGGAVFTHGDSASDTGRDQSVNPVDFGGLATQSHGTHVAGIVLGSGGATGHAKGVAPLARFVDVKFLNDLGTGNGLPEAIDWCIHNRDRDWGGGASYQGIDVINVSASSLDLADGNDVASRLANRAVDLGMVVVASMGNEGEDHYVPSPAAADQVLAVGAVDVQRTPGLADDLFASFSSYGPRAGDGDEDAFDEQKPDLMAPGVAVLSADGSLSSDGAQYKRLTGTSMSAAFVSGAVASMLSSQPSLTAAQIAELLRSTAVRTMSGTPPGQTGPDPGWRSPIGFGAVDLHGARLEMVQPQRSQVRRLELKGAGSQIDCTMRTQREHGAAHFVVERAPDITGVPGTFAAYDSVPATGDPSLADGTNMSVYSRSWAVPQPELGLPFWYRVSYTEAGVRHDGPPRRFLSPLGPPVATVEVTVVHNAYDEDVTGTIELESSQQGEAPSSGAMTFPLPATSAAVSSDWVTGTSSTGNIAWDFVIQIPAGPAESYLPPTTQLPWKLRVTEGGFINRSGRITQYRVIWHAQGGDQAFQGGPLPLPTVEGQSVIATVPQNAVSVNPSTPSRMRVGPIPARVGERVTFLLPAATSTLDRDDLEVCDLAGRRIARIPLAKSGEGRIGHWEAWDADGNPLSAGLYLARDRFGAVARVVIIGR